MTRSATSRPLLSIVLPAYEEAANLDNLLPRLAAAAVQILRETSPKEFAHAKPASPSRGRPVGDPPSPDGQSGSGGEGRGEGQSDSRRRVADSLGEGRGLSRHSVLASADEAELEASYAARVHGEKPETAFEILVIDTPEPRDETPAICKKHGARYVPRRGGS